MSPSTGRRLAALLFASSLAGPTLARPILAGPTLYGQEAASPPVRTFEPRDDAAQDAGFARFRHDVRRAAEVCTETSLRRVFAPVAPGNDVTIPPSRKFWRYWQVEDEAGLPGLCRILERAAAFGAVRSGEDTYCVPYPSCDGAMPPELPMGVYLIGVVERVEIRSQPSAMAAVLARARYPVLVNCHSGVEPCGRSSDMPPDGWRHVRLDATVGFVTDGQVDDQVQPSLIVTKLRVGWRITAFEFYD